MSCRGLRAVKLLRDVQTQIGSLMTSHFASAKRNGLRKTINPLSATYVVLVVGGMYKRVRGFDEKELEMKFQ